MVKELGISLKQVFRGAILLVVVLLAYSCCPQPGRTGTGRESDSAGSEQADPLSVNAACCICHMDFVREELSRTHFEQGVTCIYCHGLSSPHANDEHIGATPPDITYQKDEVEPMCLKCHKRHEVSPQELAKYDSLPVCTYCHGEHRIEATVSK